MQLFFQLRWYFRQEWKRYLGAVSLLVMITVLQLIPPKIVGYIIDNVVDQKYTNIQVLIWISILLLIAFIVYLFRYTWRILLFGASYQLAIKLRKDFYRQLSRQNSEFYLRHRTGDLMAHVTNDVDRVVFAAGEGVLTLVDSLVMGLAVLITMSIEISWKLTLLSLFPMPIMAIAIKYYGEQLHKRFNLAQAAFSSLNDRVQENLTGIRMIKSFGLESRQSLLISSDIIKTKEKNMHVAKIDALFDPTIYISIGLSNLLAIIGGSWMVFNKILTIGQITSFVMYLGIMIWPMLALAWMFNIVERGSAAYSRIRIMLSEKLVVKDGIEKVPTCRGTINVIIESFNYPKTNFSSLRKIRFTIQPGEILGICGPTGSGKSTILSLIQRNFDVTKGKIYYHNILLNRFKIDSWRSKLAVVNQTTFLFSDTIANNISLGNKNATKEDIKKVAKLASIHEEILQLPNGYSTQVGERGVMLSGGQKQRISIARALLLNAEILILDDALSSVDRCVEQKILNNLHKWSNGRTMIISSHRISALIEANEILVLECGSIIQRGKHEWLIKQTGWYRDMYRYQQLEAILEEHT